MFLKTLVYRFYLLLSYFENQRALIVIIVKYDFPIKEWASVV